MRLKATFSYDSIDIILEYTHNVQYTLCFVHEFFEKKKKENLCNEWSEKVKVIGWLVHIDWCVKLCIIPL